MFFGYPIAATAENWLHDCLCAMVTVIHTSLDNGQAVPAWPNIIPASHRTLLRSHTGLADRLRTYSSAARKLKRPARRRILTCLAEQNEIARLIRGATNCQRLGDLPKPIRGPIVELFKFGFSLLTELGVRDRQYSAIYDTLPYRVCPFCGSEYFDAPGTRREDLDHYLPLSRYPFASVNLRNLSPMGIKCNRYKRATDILRDKNGRRRRAFDPYANRKIKISLLKSVPFGAADGRTPSWQIDLIPCSQECRTWDQVFELRRRIRDDVLNPSFQRWLGDFATWFVKRKGTDDLSDKWLTDSLAEHAEDMADQGFMAREFLRAHVFELIHWHCRQKNRRMLDFVRALVTQAVP